MVCDQGQQLLHRDNHNKCVTSQTDWERVLRGEKFSKYQESPSKFGFLFRFDPLHYQIDVERSTQQWAGWECSRSTPKDRGIRMQRHKLHP